MRPGYVFNDDEYNTYACPWHNNLTSAIVSFRAAKALKHNPGSSFDIHTFNGTTRSSSTGIRASLWIWD